MNNTFWISLAVGLVFLFLVNYYLMTPSKKGSSGTAGSWTVYGSNGCGWTRKQLKNMDDKGISYTYVDCDEDGKQCTGMSGFPTLKDESGTMSTGYKEF
jgi:hypothetical protein